MSTINVTNIKGKGGSSPNLPDGAVITGVVTATSFSGSGANLTGVANTDFVVGTAITMAVGNIGNVNFTKSASGAGATVGSFTGVTTYFGDGSGLTGVGESIAPFNYNPDVNDTKIMLDELSTSGIGITFNKRVLQGSSGTATLKIVNAGVAGTTIQSWGVSSTTYDLTKFTLDANVSDITLNQTYQIDIPEGFIVDSTGTSYVGTAYTFTATGPVGKLFTWGSNGNGSLGINLPTNSHRSSPTQVPGIGWSQIAEGGNKTNNYGNAALKEDGTLWGWGFNYRDRLGQNGLYGEIHLSSPVQVSGTWKSASNAYGAMMASKSDGTLWSWGFNYFGQLGHNQTHDSANISSPTQIGSDTNWNGAQYTFKYGRIFGAAIKTDGTLWTWGQNDGGKLGHNQPENIRHSSPTQIPGTSWSLVTAGNENCGAIRTDGTLWMWGKGDNGCLGYNDRDDRSSPTQIPGTTWRSISAMKEVSAGTKTDGTLWMWGYNDYGALGQNNRTKYSSPVQVPGTNWSKITGTGTGVVATKTDGTMWAWGYGDVGNSVGGVPGLGENFRSSPTQIPGTEWTSDIGSGGTTSLAIQIDATP